MSDYSSFRDNIIIKGDDKGLYRRAFAVSAYGGITELTTELRLINQGLLGDGESLRQANHIPGILAKALQAVANEVDYDATIKSLHAALVEVHDHGRAICLAS